MGSARLFLKSLAATCLLLLVAQTQAQISPNELREGYHYQELSESGRFLSGDDIEVVELFLYSCPHCRNIRPQISGLKRRLPENATFREMPAVFNSGHEIHARLYWTLEAMGQPGSTHDSVFTTIHDGRKFLGNEKQIENFARAEGLDVDRVLSGLKSFRVRARMKQADRAQRRWQVTGVPCFVVDGRYLVISSRTNRMTQSDTIDAVVAVVEAINLGLLEGSRSASTSAN